MLLTHSDIELIIATLIHSWILFLIYHNFSTLQAFWNYENALQMHTTIYKVEPSYIPIKTLPTLIQQKLALK